LTHPLDTRKPLTTERPSTKSRRRRRNASRTGHLVRKEMTTTDLADITTENAEKVVMTEAMRETEEEGTGEMATETAEREEIEETMTAEREGIGETMTEKEETEEITTAE